MAKGQMRSNKEPRKPKAGAKKKRASLTPAWPALAAPAPAKEPSAMYKLFTKDRNVS